MARRLRCPHPLLALFLLGAYAPAQLGDLDARWIGYDTSTYPQARWPHAARVADLDNDGFDDVAAVNWWFFARLSVTLSDGKGRLGQPALYAHTLGALDVEIADFDADGWRDIAVSDTGPNFDGSTVSVFANERSGTFAPARRISVGSGSFVGPVGLAAADFTGDHRIDLAVARYGFFGQGNTVALLVNDGAGSFLPARSFASGAAPYKLAAGDLDGDGIADLAVARDGQKLTILFGGPEGFGAPRVYEVFSSINTDVYPTVALHDMDRDGDLDALYSSSTLWWQGESGVALFRNDGNGVLLPPVLVPLSGAVDVDAGDASGDGWPDIAIATSGGVWGLAASDGGGGFAAPQFFHAGENPVEVALRDMDRDGDLDPVVVAVDSLETAVYENPGDGGFGPRALHAVVTGAIGPAAGETMDVGDVDGDGHLDLAAAYGVVAAISGGVAVVRNRGGGVWDPPVLWPSPQAALAAKLRDLDGDGALDLLWADDFPPYDFETRRNAAGGTFGPIANWRAGTCGNTGIDAFDLDRDGDLDVCLLEGLGCPSVPTSGRRIFIAKNRGNGAFDPPYVLLSAFPLMDVTAGDFDRDGNLDLAATASTIAIHLGNGDGTFQPTITLPAGGNRIRAFDLDNDGILDLAASVTGGSGLTQGMVVYRGRGDGTFEPPVKYLGSYSNGLTGSVQIAGADLDGDGDLDLVVGNYGSHDVSFFRNRGDGTFEPHVRYGAWMNPDDVVAADFTDDGHADVAVLTGKPPSGIGLNLVLLRGQTPAPCRGSILGYGGGCAGTAGLSPRLGATGCPVLGGAVALEIDEGRPGAAGILLAGSSRASIPVLGCTLLVQPAVTVPLLLGATGGASLELTVPSLPALVGQSLVLQGAFVDPNGPAGLTTTGGLELVVG